MAPAGRARVRGRTDHAGYGLVLRPNKQKVGPLSFAELYRLASSGRLLPNDMVLKAGTQQWVAGKSVRGLFLATATTPPPLPSTAMPGGNRGRTSNPAKGFLRWLFQEGRETVIASGGQMHRLFRYGMALWRQRALSRAAASAELALDQRLYQTRLGDSRLGDRIATLDEQMQRAKATKQTLKALLSQRNEMLSQLSAQALSRQSNSPEIAENIQKAREARADCDQHSAQLDTMRSSLYPRDKATWRRLALGYGSGVAGAVLLLLFLVESTRSVTRPLTCTCWRTNPQQLPPLLTCHPETPAPGLLPTAIQKSLCLTWFPSSNSRRRSPPQSRTGPRRLLRQTSWQRNL